VVREGFWQEGKRISWKDEQAAGNDAHTPADAN